MKIENDNSYKPILHAKSVNSLSRKDAKRRRRKEQPTAFPADLTDYMHADLRFKSCVRRVAAVNVFSFSLDKKL
jgi:hypothetical protein